MSTKTALKDSQPLSLEKMFTETAIWTSDVDLWSTDVEALRKVIKQLKLHDIGESQKPVLEDQRKRLKELKETDLPFLKNDVFKHREKLFLRLNQATKSNDQQIHQEHLDVLSELNRFEQLIRSLRTDLSHMQEALKKENNRRIQGINRLLIPTDFSVHASRAVDYALSLLGSAADHIELLHVFYSPLSKQSYPDDVEKQVIAKDEQLFKLELKRIKAGFPNLVDKIHTSTQFGRLDKCIAQKVDELDIDLIIMGTGGANSTKGLLYGSNTSQIVTRAIAPVLVVPEEAPLLPPSKIAITTDLKLRGKPNKIEMVHAIAEHYKSEVRAAHVSQPIGGEVNYPTDETAKNQLRFLGLQPEQLDVVVQEELRSAINDYTSDNAIDLIVLVSHEGGLFCRLYRQGLTKRMVLRSHTPILVLHDDGEM